MPEDIYGELDAAVMNRRRGVPGVSEPMQQTGIPVLIPGTQEISHYETQEELDRRTGLTGAAMEGARSVRPPLPQAPANPRGATTTRILRSKDDASSFGDRAPEPATLDELFALFEVK